MSANPACPERAPVLLVPGFTGSKEDFLPLLDPIASAGHPAVAIDLRGQFESPGDDDPSSYELKQLADDVVTVAKGLGTPVHLVGHSFGGLVARAAVLADSSAVRSLVLLGSGPAAIPHPTAAAIALLVQALPTMDLRTIWTIKRQMELGGAPQPVSEIESFLERRFVAHHPAAMLSMARQLLSESDCVAALARLDIPMLVAFGEADDAWPPSIQREMASRLNAGTAEISGAGHSPAVENPEGTADVLLRFWSNGS